MASRRHQSLTTGVVRVTNPYDVVQQGESDETGMMCQLFEATFQYFRENGTRDPVVGTP